MDQQGKDRTAGSQMMGNHIANDARGGGSITIRHARVGGDVWSRNQYDTTARSANCSQSHAERRLGTHIPQK